MAKQIKKSPGPTKPIPTNSHCTFSFRAPEASIVELVGDFTEWQKNSIKLQKQDDGVWRVTVGLEPGEHRYRFIVDGTWSDDPDCPIQVPNPYGSHDALIRVSTATQA